MGFDVDSGGSRRKADGLASQPKQVHVNGE